MPSGQFTSRSLSTFRAGKFFSAWIEQVKVCGSCANIDAVPLPGVRRNRKPRHVKPVPDPQDTATRPRDRCKYRIPTPITMRVMSATKSGWLAQGFGELTGPDRSTECQRSFYHEAPPPGVQSLGLLSDRGSLTGNHGHNSCHVSAPRHRSDRVWAEKALLLGRGDQPSP